ncbi:MAG: glycosyltransferase family 4 protein [Vicinamibacterales bacterium]
MISLHIDTARTWRGGQNQALLTVMGLRAIGQRSVLVAHPEGELLKRAQGPDVVGLAPRSEVDVAAAWRLARIIRDLSPHIIHAHDPHGVAMAGMALSIGAASRWRERRRAPALVAARRVDFHLKANSFSRWKYRQVDAFITASEAIRQMLIGDGIPANRVITVHEGIDVARLDAIPAVNVHEALWLPHQAPLVGNVAALVPHKGQRYLIEAAHLVIQKIPDARFVILGEGELREHLEHLVHEHHLTKHVLLPGFRQDVIGCIKGFDLFVMSSVTEGLGTSLLDAMACHKAIVATRAGGIPEVVADGRNGLLVEPRNPHDLAQAVIALLEDHEGRARMADHGYARVSSRFTVARMVAETAAVYERLVRLPHLADSPPT